VDYEWGQGDDQRLVALLNDQDGLHGIPLAIRLAAQRLRDSTLEDVLDAWRDRRTKSLRIPGLADQDVGSLDSMEFSIALSYDALPRAGLARPLFALFADLPAGADRELLRAIGDEAQEAAAVLSRHGLVTLEGGRFTMLYPLRSFASDLSPDEAADLAPSLDRYLLEFALRWCGRNEQWAANQGEAVYRLTIELSNLHAALDRAGKREDNRYVTHLTDALSRYYAFALPGPQATERLLRGRDAAHRLGDQTREANCILRLGDVHRALSEHLQSWAHYRDALRIYTETRNRAGEAACYQGLGEVHRMQDENLEAQTHFTKALQIYRETRDRMGEAECILGLGEVHRISWEMDEAREHFTAAWRISRDAGSRTGEARAIRGLGDLFLKLEDYPNAQAYYRKALQLYRETRNRIGEARCIRGLGDIYLSLDRYPRARKHYTRALQLYRESGNRTGEGRCIRGLGDIYLKLREYPEARHRYEEALVIHRATRDRYSTAFAEMRMGEVVAGLGDREAACVRMRTAAAGFAEIGQYRLEAKARTFLRANGCGE
jgi:tetratricopeptide (TPR) repeat protein